MSGEATAPGMASLEARLASRISVCCVLDLVEFGRNDTPLLAKLLIGAILEANIGRVTREMALQMQYARLEDVVPDALRRPVSVNALATSLHQPFETVRRHVKQLLARGLLATRPNGVYVPAEVMASPPFVALAAARYQRVIQLHEELRAAGVLTSAPLGLPPLGDPGAPVRAVGRLYSDYFLRVIENMQRRVRDPLTALLLLSVIRGGTEHISHAEAGVLMREGVIPADMRTPVRVAELSRRLGIPYETVRRHMGWLTQEGLCERCVGGFRMTPSFATSPETLAMLNENLVNLHRMFRQIEAVVAQLDAGASGCGGSSTSEMTGGG